MVEEALSITLSVPELEMFPFDPSRMIRLFALFADPMMTDEDTLRLPVTVRPEPTELDALD